MHYIKVILYVRKTTICTKINDLLFLSNCQVSITVHNSLKMEGITIHWHGLVQRGTPWMDGADMISQCPILPGQTFEYR